jgi:DNA-binding NarL/FixJ family response regulator
MVLSRTKSRNTVRRMPPADPTTSDRPITVAVIEEHEILRCGLAACLAEDRQMEVSVARADVLPEVDTDIAVVSSQAARRHRFLCPIVVCSDDPGGPRNVAVGNDVAGVLHQRSLTAAQLHATVRAAAAGLRVKSHVDDDDGREALEPRALQVLELVADGHSTREIAHRMSYSERTIKKLITGLEGQLEARSRAHLVARAIRRGVI